MLRKLLVAIVLFATILQATTPINSNVTRLYIATFDRAPDAKGLKYWVENSGLFLEEIALSFFEQPEAKELYPSKYSNEDFIKSIYKNLFNRKPDSAGMAYWKNALDKNLIARSLFILAVTNGAVGDDKKILDNKTKVGLAFATAGGTNVDQAYKLMQSVTANEDSTIALICNPLIEYCDNFYIDTNSSSDNNTSSTTSDNNTTTTTSGDNTILIISTVVPIILDASGNVLENATSGAIVSRISIANRGDSNITAMTLSGDGSGNFEISLGGQVTLKAGASLDYETDESYNLDVVATNRAGNSNIAELTILVTDVANNVPTLTNFSKTIAEGTAINTKIGRIIITTGDSPITSINLSGTDSETFEIETNGDIILKSEVDFDTKALYILSAIARNGAGVSTVATVEITITNVVDETPILASYTGTINENTPIDDTLTNSIAITKEGDSEITLISLSGEGSDKFGASSTGVITLKSTPDFETKKLYSLNAIATNSAGDSDSVTVTINIINIIEIAPILATIDTIEIAEDIAIGTTVVTVNTAGADTDANIDTKTVRSYDIVSGNTDDAFAISDTGVLTSVKELDYDTTPTYTLEVKAENLIGDSNTISITINITEVD